jgi:hypothetical protein
VEFPHEFPHEFLDFLRFHTSFWSFHTSFWAFNPYRENSKREKRSLEKEKGKKESLISSEISCTSNKYTGTLAYLLYWDTDFCEFLSDADAANGLADGRGPP